MTVEEAKKIALEHRPEHYVESVTELEKCFVVSLLPDNYSEEDGLYIGGGIRVDKKTGKCKLFNPMLEGGR